MPGMRIFEIVLTGASGERLALTGGRDFGKSAPPFYLKAGNDTWPMSLQEAHRLGRAAREMEFLYSRSERGGSRPVAKPYFTHAFEHGGGVELGIVAVGDSDQVFLCLVRGGCS